MGAFCGKPTDDETAAVASPKQQQQQQPQQTHNTPAHTNGAAQSDGPAVQQPVSSEQQPPFQSSDSGAVDEADVNVAVAGVDPEFNDQEAAQQAGA
jgi:hypothetical protein